MNKLTAILLSLSTLLLFTACQAPPRSHASGSDPNPTGLNPTVYSAKAARIERNSRAALNDLYAESNAARRIGQAAQAILVFPKIYKGGFLIGAQGGDGTLFFNDGSVAGFYNNAAASYGLQAGIQKFAYALFMMDDYAIQQLNESGGWEIGGSPTFVVADEGVSGSISTTTANRGVYAFFFNHSGLMAGISLEGTKISPIYP